MSFLRIITNILKPTEEQLKNKKPGELLRLRISLYRAILRYLIKVYSHYAVCDTFTIGNGAIKVIHEYRDVEFENELIRNKIDTKAHLSQVSIPACAAKKNNKAFFSYFKYKDVLRVYVGDKELEITHGNDVLVSSTMDVKLLQSTCEDILCRNTVSISRDVLSLLTKKKQQPLFIEAEEKITDEGTRRVEKKESVKKTPSRRKRGLFTRDVMDAGLMPVNLMELEAEQEIPSDRRTGTSNNKKEIVEEPPTTIPEPQPIKKRGFDIDTSF